MYIHVCMYVCICLYQVVSFAISLNHTYNYIQPFLYSTICQQFTYIFYTHSIIESIHTCMCICMCDIQMIIVQCIVLLQNADPTIRKYISAKHQQEIQRIMYSQKFLIMPIKNFKQMKKIIKRFEYIKKVVLI